MTRKFFITFGGPTYKYHNAVKKIGMEAKELNYFDKIVLLTEKTIKNTEEFLEFYNKNYNFMENNSRGYGYWIWKPYIVKKILEKMNDNDILFYADSGCTINIKGKNRLDDYVDMVNKSEYGILSFQLSHLEKQYTKMDVFEYFNCYDLLETKILVGGIFVLRKCKQTVELVDKWYETVCNYYLITDEPSKIPNDPSFIEHRHDQSIWSLLRKNHGSVIIDDETYFENWNNGINFPIWATRKV